MSKSQAQVLADATVCWICGGELDFDADPRSSLAPSVDHIIPLSLGGHPSDPAGLRPCHYGCNSRRGNTMSKGTQPQIKRSREW
jgi:5-methylcytosine-specific restriction endonuclease McrA